MAAVVFLVYDALAYVIEYVGIGKLLVYGYALYSSIQAKQAAHKARQAADALQSQVQERMQMVRQAITTRRIIYGTVRVSGPITFFSSTTDKTKLHILITLAGHEISGIDDIYFNEERIDLDASGLVTSGRWAGYVIIKKGLGTTAGDADLLADMVANTAGVWTTDHRQTGCAKLYIRLTFNRDLMAQGLPNVSCVVRGKPVYDPRSTLTAWSDNAALCIRDYMTSDVTGVGALSSEIDDTVLIAAANICDERVDLATRLDDFVAVDLDPPLAPTAVNNTPIPSDYSIYASPVRFAITFYDASGETTIGVKGDPILVDPLLFSPTAVVDNTISNIPIGPAGTIGRRIYSYTYLTSDPSIPIAERLVGDVADNTSTTYHQTLLGPLATAPTVSSYSLTNIVQLSTGTYIAQGDAITLTTTGTLPAPLITGTSYYWIRHAANRGRLATSYANAMADIGIVLTTRGTGIHTVNAGSEPRYRCNGTIDSSSTPQQTIMDMLSSMAGVFTYVGGKFSIYAGAWRTPVITLTQNDLDGPIQSNFRMSRRDVFNGVKGVFSSPADLWQPTDYPPVTNATYLAEDQGSSLWSELPLNFTTSPAAAQRLAKISLEKVRQQITVVLRCNITALRIQVGDIIGFTYERFGWTNKYFEVVNLKITTRESGADSRIGVDITGRETASAVYDWNNGEETILDPAPNTNLANPLIVEKPSPLLLESGTDQLYIRKDGTVFSRIKVSWPAALDSYVLSGGSVEIQYQRVTTTIWNTADTLNGNETYAYILDVEDGQSYNVRVRFRNQISIYSEWTYYFAYVVLGKTVPPATVTGFTVGQNGNVVVMKWAQVADIDLAGYEIRYLAQGGSNWDAAIPLTKVTRGTQVTSAALPPGSWTLLIAARDTSGNYSTTKSAYNINMTNALDIIHQLEQAPDWLGIKTNFVKHWTGVLIPDSQDAASLDTWDTFDIFVPNPYTTCTYETPETDIGFVDTVRVWASAAATLGPGVSVGYPNPTMEIDYHSGAGYNGFEAWTIGDVTGRYFKEKLVLLSANGVAYVASFKPTLDVASHMESATGVVIGATGTAIIFADRFYFTPNIQLTVQGGAGLTPSFTAQSATGFTAHVYDATGAEVGGIINWTATGD